ncbi:MAG TPA: rod shape-determining protein [Clostridia bacterium]|nr:rod shape-determining protein [Clostridia bacterium]
MLFFRDLGIDLGTANTLVYMKGKGIIIREPSVVAIRKEGNKREILAVGEEAKNMIGRTPGNIIAMRPLKDGVIADFEITEAMLSHFIRKSMPRGFGLGIRTRVIICVPCGVTGVEKRAVEEAARNAGAHYVNIIEEPLASAIGAGLPVDEPSGSMIVDIGGGTSEMAILSYGGIVQATSLRVAGNAFDEAIVQYVKKEFNMAIGERTAEDIKLTIGSAFPSGDEKTMNVRGRDLMSGLPKNVTITSAQVREALSEPLNLIIEGIRITLEKTPPELASDVMERGIVLAGGGALLSGFDLLIRSETGIPVYIAEDPLDCVVLGAGRALERLDILARSDRNFS